VAGAIFHGSGRSSQGGYADAVREAHGILELNPKHQTGYVALAFGPYMLEEYPEAAEAGIRLTDPTNVQWLGMLASIHASWGKKDQAHELLRRIDAAALSQHVSPMVHARVHIALGNHSQALDSLERGFRERDTLMPWIKADPRFDTLRADPRFIALLRKMNLSSEARLGKVVWAKLSGSAPTLPVGPLPLFRRFSLSHDFFRGP